MSLCFNTAIGNRGLSVSYGHAISLGEPTRGADGEAAAQADVMLLFIGFIVNPIIMLILLVAAGVVDAQADGPVGRDIAISLTRTMCHGKCPEYEVTMKGNGEVQYFGHAYVLRLGKHFAQIDPGVVRKLATEAEEMGFFTLTSCAAKIHDVSYSEVTVDFNGKRNTILNIEEIESSNGPLLRFCPGLEKVTAFCRHIDDALRSATWKD